MQQRLIVEGKDGLAIASLLEKRNLPPPTGYESKTKFRKFIKSVGGINNVNEALDEEITSQDVKRIGVIIDADDKGISNRLDSIKNILLARFPNYKIITETTNGAHYKISEDAQVSIWVMPNNESNGYLEHFLATLIPYNLNDVWTYATNAIDIYLDQKYASISNTKIQKAKLHTYLALMENPGLPFGTAMKSNYFDAGHPNADLLEEWFKNAFILEDQ